MKKYRALFLDTDGTLLDTLQDILNAVNFALKGCGYEKQYSYEEGKRLIGGGAYVLAQRAIAFAHPSEEQYKAFEELFLKKYLELQDATTKPFDGLTELLLSIKDEYKLFIISNKPQFLLDDIIKKTFPEGLFIEACGHKIGNPEKPDPILINYLVDKYHLNKKECLFIGDSITDIQTAINGNVDSCLVTYGYGVNIDSFKEKATYVANSVEDLFKLLK